MSLRIVSLVAAIMLVAACGTREEQSALSGGDGQSSALGQGTVENAPAPGSKEEFEVQVGDRVLFGTDRFDLAPEAQRTLDLQAAWLQRYPNTRLSIEGHADERGTREYNLALSDRRATSVRNYLVAQGVDAGRLRTIGYGKERPAVLGSNEAAWAANRRAVSVVEGASVASN